MNHISYLPGQVTPVPKPQEVQKVEPVVRQPEATKQAADTTPVATPPKVDNATDHFNMLSMDGPNENGSETASADDNAWACFQCMYLFPLIGIVFISRIMLTLDYRMRLLIIWG